MKKLTITFLLFFHAWAFSPFALAHAPCPIIEAQLTQQMPEQPAPTKLQLVSMQFSDKRQDLAILETLNTDSHKQHRITFGGIFSDSQQLPAQACHVVPIALVQGGNWGWHVLWKTPDGLFYGRVDGDAWVSSVPKRLTKLVASKAQFKLDGQSISVNWQQIKNGVTANMQAVSSDEGRSWNNTEMSH